ncbi:MAG: ATP-binding protein, partial [Bryobacteraceae bacterium]
DMSLLLRPSMLDDLGLIPAVQWQAREVSRTSNVYVQVSADPIPEDIPDEHKTCIYRVVQEALRNAVRHSKAKSVRVRLSRDAEHLVLTIQDDGHGFVPSRDKGLGLLGIQERVTHLHGKFSLESTAGEGTSIRVELPLAFDGNRLNDEEPASQADWYSNP